jgi:hypothetical protein
MPPRRIVVIAIAIAYVLAVKYVATIAFVLVHISNVGQLARAS